MTPQNTHNPQLHIVFSSGIPQTSDGNLAVVPKIIQYQSIHLKERRIMLEKYRHYVQHYADSCAARNKEVLDYNAKVLAHIAQTENQNYAQQVTAAFNDAFHKVSIEAYNHAARLRNIELAQPLILLKKHTPIRKSTEHVFSMLLFKYAMQIEEKNNILINCGATTTRALQKVQVNHYELANTEIDGVFTLPYCRRTIHNHINRLVEAGVLFDYTFKGREKPVEYHVNSQILTFFCRKTRKSFNSENQLFTYQFEKDLHNNEIDTRTYINNNKIIEPVNKQSRSKEIETPSSLLSKMQLSQNDNNENTYRNTNQRKQSENAAAADFSTKTAIDMANYLTSAILDRQTLLENFSNGDFATWRIYESPPKRQLYVMVTLAHLKYEAENGIMLKADFFTLLHQTLFKCCGTIYRKSHKNHRFNFIGASAEGYKKLDTYLRNHNGTIPSKKVAFQTFKGLLWRIKFAANYFNSNNHNPLFINDYLDPTRTQSKECGFAYTLQFYKSHLQQKEHAADVVHSKAKKLEKIQERKTRVKAISLVERKINDLKNGKITIPQLFDYVNHNAHIPMEIRDKLPEYIKRSYQNK